MKQYRRFARMLMLSFALIFAVVTGAAMTSGWYSTGHKTLVSTGHGDEMNLRIIGLARGCVFVHDWQRMRPPQWEWTFPGFYFHREYGNAPVFETALLPYVDYGVQGLAMKTVIVPLLIPSAILLITTLSLLRLGDRSSITPGCCLRCGYDMTGNTSGICSECGEKTPMPRDPAPSRPLQ